MSSPCTRFVCHFRIEVKDKDKTLTNRKNSHQCVREKERMPQQNQRWRSIDSPRPIIMQPGMDDAWTPPAKTHVGLKIQKVYRQVKSLLFSPRGWF